MLPELALNEGCVISNPTKVDGYSLGVTLIIIYQKLCNSRIDPIFCANIKEFPIFAEKRIRRDQWISLNRVRNFKMDRISRLFEIWSSSRNITGENLNVKEMELYSEDDIHMYIVYEWFQFLHKLLLVEFQSWQEIQNLIPRNAHGFI